jgi:hypothetical protein
MVETVRAVTLFSRPETLSIWCHCVDNIALTTSVHYSVKYCVMKTTHMFCLFYLALTAVCLCHLIHQWLVLKVHMTVEFLRVVMWWEILQSEEWILHFVSYSSGLEPYSSTIQNKIFVCIFHTWYCWWILKIILKFSKFHIFVTFPPVVFWYFSLIMIL